MIIKTDFNKLAELSESGEEGLVLLGTGGDIQEWVDGVSKSIKEEGIGDLNVEDVYVVGTSGGRTDTLLLLTNAQVDIGKLALWRLRFGNCFWLSDYIDQYIDHHNDVDEKYIPDEDF